MVFPCTMESISTYRTIRYSLQSALYAYICTIYILSINLRQCNTVSCGMSYYRLNLEDYFDVDDMEATSVEDVEVVQSEIPDKR